MLESKFTRPGQSGFRSIVTCVVASIAALSGCAESESHAHTIRFSLSDRSAAEAQTAVVESFRFYVHDVMLLTADGAMPLRPTPDKWQNERVALIDLSGTAANATLRGTTSGRASTFTGIRFTVGVPFDMNHADPLRAAAPLDRTDMFWAWQSGHKFLRVDLRDADRSWSFHLGSTGCSSASALRPPQSACAQPNTVIVELTGFDPTRQAVRVPIETWMEAMRLAGHETCTGGYAHNPACAAPYAATGLDLRMGRCAQASCAAQRMFEIE